MDFVNVVDITQVNILAMESDIENEIFNVGTGISTSISQLANILIEALNVDIVPKLSNRKTIVTRRQADISKIKEMFGYKVTVLPKDGLTEVARDIKQNQDSY